MPASPATSAADPRAASGCKTLNPKNPSSLYLRCSAVLGDARSTAFGGGCTGWNVAIGFRSFQNAYAANSEWAGFGQATVVAEARAHGKAAAAHSSGWSLRAAAALQQHLPAQAFLERFLALNPFSAAAVACCGVGLRQLMSADESSLLETLRNVPGVTQAATRLFHAQANAGMSVKVLIGTALASMLLCSCRKCLLSGTRLRRGREGCDSGYG